MTHATPQYAITGSSSVTTRFHVKDAAAFLAEVDQWPDWIVDHLDLGLGEHLFGIFSITSGFVDLAPKYVSEDSEETEICPCDFAALIERHIVDGEVCVMTDRLETERGAEVIVKAVTSAGVVSEIDTGAIWNEAAAFGAFPERAWPGA